MAAGQGGAPWRTGAFLAARAAAPEGRHAFWSPRRQGVRPTDMRARNADVRRVRSDRAVRAPTSALEGVPSALARGGVGERSAPGERRPRVRLSRPEGSCSLVSQLLSRAMNTTRLGDASKRDARARVTARLLRSRANRPKRRQKFRRRPACRGVRARRQSLPSKLGKNRESTLCWDRPDTEALYAGSRWHGL